MKQKTENKITKYLSGIPNSLLDILTPGTDVELERLLENYKALRIREKERNYVMEIQKHYNIQISPNENLKKTMIRVRLSLLKREIRDGIKPDEIDINNLPIDPLE